MSPLPALLPAASACEAPLLDRAGAFLTALAADLAPEAVGPPGCGRPRVLPAVALWGRLTVCVLRLAEPEGAVASGGRHRPVAL